MRLAVVSPFLDRQHGTEMCIVEQIERLARREGWTIELYSQKVSGINGDQLIAGSARNPSGGIQWHKVLEIPGPHLLKFIWWFFANHWQRRRDWRSGEVRADLVYTPGTNCLDADVITVHIVFHAFYELARGELVLRRVPLKMWPRLIHRKLYYKLIMFLERRIYRDPRVRLVAVSNLIARQLQNYLGRTDAVVIPNTVDIARFNRVTCQARRAGLRQTFHFAENEFVLLLIGNDWKKKGLDSLLRAAARLIDYPLRLMVVGEDDARLYCSMVEKCGLQERISFEAPASDVLQFYAAADLYVGPSLEDGFNLPILEAMACGLPVIASVRTGASENITDGQTGLILSDPQNAELLAQLIRRLYEDEELRQRIGEAAADFVRANCGWDQNAERTRQLLEAIHISHSRP